VFYSSSADQNAVSACVCVCVCGNLYGC